MIAIDESAIRDAFIAAHSRDYEAFKSGWMTSAAGPALSAEARAAVKPLLTEAAQVSKTGSASAVS